MQKAMYIFTFYMLALSLLPCSDGGGGVVDMLQHLFDESHVHVELDHTQHSNTCDEDACSPFCICNCCSITVDQPVKTQLAIAEPPIIFAKLTVFETGLLSSSYNHAVWQPPRSC